MIDWKNNLGTAKWRQPTAHPTDPATNANPFALTFAFAQFYFFDGRAKAKESASNHTHDRPIRNDKTQKKEGQPLIAPTRNWRFSG